MENGTSEKESELPLRIFRCEASTEYAKRVMAHSDIVFSLQCLVCLRDLNRCNDGDELLREALWNSAVIRLLSVFNGPNALKLDILDDLPDGAREAYQFFNNYRNKHVAHKVNPIDQVKAGVILSDLDREKKEVLGVGNLSMKDAPFSDAAFVDSLGKFTDALRMQIEKEIKIWSDRTLKEAKGRQIDELYELPPLRVVVPSRGHFHKGET